MHTAIEPRQFPDEVKPSTSTSDDLGEQSDNNRSSHSYDQPQSTSGQLEISNEQLTAETGEEEMTERVVGSSEEDQVHSPVECQQQSSSDQTTSENQEQSHEVSVQRGMEGEENKQSASLEPTLED